MRKRIGGLVIDIDPRTTVAELVLEHPECAAALRRIRIDFCCRGDMSLEAACAANGLDAREVVVDLGRIVARGADRPDDPRALSTEDLIDHIVSTHHEYLRETLPLAVSLAEKVRRVHGSHDERLEALEGLVHELAASLFPHLEEEEERLFPALVAREPNAITVARSLSAMIDDHLAVGGLLARIRAITSDFSVPTWACASYRTLFATLENLEADTLEHVHLENHVLVPRFVSA